MLLLLQLVLLVRASNVASAPAVAVVIAVAVATTFAAKAVAAAAAVVVAACAAAACDVVALTVAVERLYKKYSSQGKNPFFGCLVGRFANRIAKGSFDLGMGPVQLEQNNGENALHGGSKGFDKYVAVSFFTLEREIRWFLLLEHGAKALVVETVVSKSLVSPLT